MQAGGISCEEHPMGSRGVCSHVGKVHGCALLQYTNLYDRNRPENDCQTTTPARDDPVFMSAQNSCVTEQRRRTCICDLWRLATCCACCGSLRWPRFPCSYRLCFCVARRKRQRPGTAKKRQKYNTVKNDQSRPKRPPTDMADQNRAQSQFPVYTAKSHQKITCSIRYRTATLHVRPPHLTRTPWATAHCSL